jgi:hypothetical protein
MRRKFFAAFAVLLAVMLVTCDLLESPFAAKDDSPQFTPDGRPMARLKINVGSSNAGRAVNETLAKTSNRINYYEVAFKDPGGSGKVYRLAWDKGATAEILIPMETYLTAEDAVVFAGIKSYGGLPNILLAVGNLTDTDEGFGSAPGKTITSNTISVTFTLDALENDVNLDAASSTFKIIGPNAKKTESIIGGVIPDELISGNNYPVFDLPACNWPFNTPNFSSYPYSGNSIVGHYQFNNANFAGVALAEGWGFSEPDVISGLTGGTVITVPIFPDNTSGLNNAIDGNFYFYIRFTGLTAGGLCSISIDVPVFAINKDGNDTVNGFTPGEWHIYGGINKDALDGIGGDGGAILLRVDALDPDLEGLQGTSIGTVDF